MNLFKVRNENTPGNQIEYEYENRIIYNSTFTFKEDARIEKKWLNSLKGELYAKKRSATNMSY